MATLHNYNANLTGPAGSFGRVLRNSGLFPENFFVANPQFVNSNYVTNFGHSNYHPMQAQLTFRRIHGVTGSATYNWSKGMTLANSLSDPLDRSEHTLQAGVRPHEFRANGSFDLPIGPNKLLFRNSHGWLARALERWQTSWILNLSSGSWSTISATSRTYSATGVPDVVIPVDLNALKDYEWGNRPTGL
jgi:hypothetical protein